MNNSNMDSFDKDFARYAKKHSNFNNYMNNHINNMAEPKVINSPAMEDVTNDVDADKENQVNYSFREKRGKCNLNVLHSHDFLVDNKNGESKAKPLYKNTNYQHGRNIRTIEPSVNYNVDGMFNHNFHTVRDQKTGILQARERPKFRAARYCYGYNTKKLMEDAEKKCGAKMGKFKF